MTTEIRVLGPGCIRCQQLYANAVATVAELGLDARVEKVHDLGEMTARGILATPALVVNDELVMAGHVATVSQLREVLSKPRA